MAGSGNCYARTKVCEAGVFLDVFTRTARFGAYWVNYNQAEVAAILQITNEAPL